MFHTLIRQKSPVCGSQPSWSAKQALVFRSVAEHVLRRLRSSSDSDEPGKPSKDGKNQIHSYEAGFARDLQ